MASSLLIIWSLVIGHPNREGGKSENAPCVKTLVSGGEGEDWTKSRPKSLATVENVPPNLRTGKPSACDLCKKMHWWSLPLQEFHRLHDNAQDRLWYRARHSARSCRSIYELILTISTRYVLQAR